MIYGYARVSTKGQAKDGNSLEAQENALRLAGATEIYSDAFKFIVNTCHYISLSWIFIVCIQFIIPPIKTKVYQPLHR